MKNKVINIRVEEKTFNKVTADSKKANKSVSQYIREMILSADIRTDPKVRLAINDLRKEINRIGVNINQIAKNTNAGIYSDSDRKNLIDSQRALLMEFRRMKERIYETL